VKLSYDKKADALYLQIGDAPVARTETVRPGLMVDVDEDGNVIGIEVLSVARQMPDADLSRVQLDLAS